jgi:hypothetical protein
MLPVNAVNAASGVIFRDRLRVSREMADDRE